MADNNINNLLIEDYNTNKDKYDANNLLQVSNSILKSNELNNSAIQNFANIIDANTEQYATEYNLSNFIDTNYEKYGIMPSNHVSQEELDRARAKAQSAGEQFGHAVMQAVTNEVILGTVKGFSDIIDFCVNLGKMRTGENDYTNPVSQYLEDLQNKVRDKFAIYEKDPNGKFSFGDFGWWMNGLVNTATTVSLMIPGLAVTKGISLLSKLVRANKWLMYGSKVAKGARMIAKPTEALSREGLLTRFAQGYGQKAGVSATKIQRHINEWSQYGFSSVISRTAENYQEARDTYKNILDDARDKLADLSPEEREKLYQNNPNFRGMSDDEIASNIAGSGAFRTFAWDYGMLGMDLLQFRAISSLWKGASKETTAAMRIANRNAARKLANGETAVLEKNNWLARRKDDIVHLVRHPLIGIQAVEWGEGIEEGYQGVMQDIGETVGKRILDPSTDFRTIGSYLSDPDIWEQAFWGVAGGHSFQGVGSAVGNTKRRIQAEYLHKRGKISDQEYNLLKICDDQARLSEIEGRTTRFQKFADEMALLNKGLNPYRERTDENGQVIKNEDGSIEYENISSNPDYIQLLKLQAVDNFVTELTLDAAKVGNYDLLKTFISDPAFEKYFKEQNLGKLSNEEVSTRIKQVMSDVYDRYQSEISHIIDTVDMEKEPEIGILMARDNVRRELGIKSGRTLINDIERFLNNHDGNTSEVNAYKNRQRAIWINQRLEQLKKEEEAALNARNATDINRRISEEGYNQIIKDINEERHTLMEYAVNTTDINTRLNLLGKDFKEELSKTVKGSNISIVTDMFNEFFKGETNEEKGFKSIFNENLESGRNGETAPPTDIQQKIANLNELEYYVHSMEKSLPQTKQEYRDLFDRFATQQGKFAKERFDKATANIIDWIKQQPDIDKAYVDILNGKVPEKLKDDITLLKIGHGSTRFWSAMLLGTVNNIKKERNQEQQKTNNTAHNGHPANPAIINSQEQQKKPEEQQKKPEEKTNKQSKENTKQNRKNTNAINTTIDEHDDGVIIHEDNENSSSSEHSAASESVDAEQANRSKTIFSITTSYVKAFGHDNQSLIDYINGTNQSLLQEIENALAHEGITNDLHSAAQDAMSHILSIVYKYPDKFKLNNEILEKLQNTINNLKNEILNKSVRASLSISEWTDDELAADTLDSILESLGYKQGDEIDVEELCKQIVSKNDSNVSKNIEILLQIAEKFNDISEKYDGNYRLTNTEYLEGKSLTEIIQNKKLEITNENNSATNEQKLHIATPSQRNTTTSRAISNLKEGDEVTIEYTKTKNGEQGKSLSITNKNGVEVGYLGTVTCDENNNNLRLENQKKGFVYVINRLPSGVISTNVDSFFEDLINGKSKDAKQILELLQKINNHESLTNEDITNLLFKNKLIQKLLNNGAYKTQFEITKLNGLNNITIANSLLFDINSVLNYTYLKNNDTEAKLDSYNTWKTRIYNNYSQTKTLQDKLAQGKNVKLTAKISGKYQGKLIYNDTERNVADESLHFNPDEMPYVQVNSNGDVIGENGENYGNFSGCEGMSGLLIGTFNGVPLISQFNDSVPINQNSEIYQALQTELHNILESFLTSNEDFSTISEKLSKLLVPLCRNIHIYNNGNDIHITVNNKSLARIYNTEKGRSIYTKFNNKGITVYRYSERVIGQFVESERVIGQFVENIAHQLEFNINSEIDDETFKKSKDGKLELTIGNFHKTYDSFAHYFIEEKAANTRQGTNEQGKYFESRTEDPGIYLDSNTVEVIKEEEKKKTAKEIIESGSTEDAVSTKDILVAAEFTADELSLLTGEKTGFPIIPDSVYYDSKSNTEAYVTSDGKIVFGKESVKNVPTKQKLRRILIHENLHRQFEKHGAARNRRTVTSLLEVHRQWVEAVKRDLTDPNVSPERKKLAEQVNIMIEKGGFGSVEEYTSRYEQAIGGKLNESNEELEQRFVEEFLVECLTRPELAKYMNETQYNGIEISDDGVATQSKDKSLLQKLIDILGQILGIKSVNAGSLFAQEYALMAEQNLNNEEIKNETEQITNAENKTQTEEQTKQNVNDQINPENQSENGDINALNENTGSYIKEDEIEETEDEEDNFGLQEPEPAKTTEPKQDENNIISNNENSNEATTENTENGKSIEPTNENPLTGETEQDKSPVEKEGETSDNDGVLILEEPNESNNGETTINRNEEGNTTDTEINSEDTHTPNMFGKIANSILSFFGANPRFSLGLSIGELSDTELTIDEKRLDSFADNPAINPHGIETVSDMNSYLSRYTSQQQQIILSLMDKGMLKYVCR